MKLLFAFVTCTLALIPYTVSSQTKTPDVNVLVGNWKIDMSPQDSTDGNFAEMTIIKVEDGTYKGEFYRSGVRIKNAQINTQLGTIYCAHTSGDNSGTYNTSFYYEDGILHGTTHSMGRNFLAVWTATKIDE